MARETLTRLVPTTASALGMVRAAVNGIFLISILSTNSPTALKWAMVISLFFSTIGYLTPLTTKTSAVLVFIYEVVMRTLGSPQHDAMLGVYCLIVLAFSPCGDGFSVDSLAGSRKKREFAYGFPILLMRILVALTYLTSALIELSIAGVTYFPRDSWPSLALAILVLVWQLLFPLAVFWKGARWWILGAGVVFHLSTWFLMNTSFPFQLAMYVVFVDWDKVAGALAMTPFLRRISSWWQDFRSPPEEFPGVRADGVSDKEILLWDGDCGFCSAMVQKMKRLTPRSFAEKPYQAVRDQLPDDVLRWSTRQAHWVNADGSVSGGSVAVFDLLKSSGRPWLAAILRSAPFRPLMWLGYRLVATHRGTLARFVK